MAKTLKTNVTPLQEKKNPNILQRSSKFPSNFDHIKMNRLNWMLIKRSFMLKAQVSARADLVKASV